MERPLSIETKRAFFRAQVITVEAGEREVSVNSLMAALLVCPDIAEACQDAGLPVAHLIETFGVEEPLRRLKDAEASLADRGILFGSREHIDSLADVLRPLSEPLLRTIRGLEEKLRRSDVRVSVFDILEALTTAEGPLAETATTASLNVAVLRSAASDDRNKPRA